MTTWILLQRGLSSQQQPLWREGHKRFRAFVGTHPLAWGGLPAIGQCCALHDAEATGIGELKGQQRGRRLLARTPFTGHPKAAALAWTHEGFSIEAAAALLQQRLGGLELELGLAHTAAPSQLQAVSARRITEQPQPPRTPFELHA